MDGSIQGGPGSEILPRDLSQGNVWNVPKEDLQYFHRGHTCVYKIVVCQTTENGQMKEINIALTQL